VPNLSVGDQFGVNRTFIRGVGLTSIDLGADGAVAFLQNEAVIARPAEQLTGFYDLERVEVLRGPQGTTYGRGATAGVVNLVTKKPTDVLDGYANLTLGNYSSKSFEGAIGGPFSDRVSGRIAAKWDKRHGYGENLFTGNPVDDRDAYAVRASLRIKASDTVLIDLVGDYFHEDDYNYAFHYFGPTVSAFIPATFYGGTTIFDHGGNIRNVWSREDAINQRHGSSATAIVDWKPDNFELKSVTSWRDFTRFNRDDLGVSDAHFFGQNNYNEKSTSISQEFTLSATAGGIDWLAGANYFHEKNPGSVVVPLYNIFRLLSGGQCSPDVPTAPAPCNLLDNGFYNQSGEVKTDAYGVYLQGTKEIATRTKLTLGARFNNEKRSGSGFFQFDALGVLVPTNKEKSWNAVTPRLLLEHRTENGSLVYGSVTRGFKSGVINIGSLNDVINPEYVTAFETGFKTKYLDNRATFSAAAFYYNYKDLQVGFVNAQSTVQTVNAAKARNFGLELESDAKLTDNLELDVAATYLNAKYKEFLQGDYRNGFATVDLSGNYLQNAPKYSGHLGLTYGIPVGGAGKVTLRGETVFSDKVYFTEFNNADAEQGAYALLNFNARYEPTDGHWAVTAWIRNAGDKLVKANNIITAPLYASVQVGTLMPPRTYGVTVNFKL
jgi:iron complex outermembrane recepter protein